MKVFVGYDLRIQGFEVEKKYFQVDRYFIQEKIKEGTIQV
uniref:Uncharacterized protein n=1 Tax=Physcomitrium patens TaxID=3218 RepID=A0A2K1KCR1_PHYPA|nr:hypothetical protein PHYPA_010757 [Physcomitrium patens]